MANATHRLTELLTQAPVSLDRVMATVASVAPDPPEEAEVVAQLDQLAHQLSDDLAAAAREKTIESVLAYVYGQLGFVGDTNDYYNPDNSLVHRVLTRRRGLPLTLAMVGSEIARRVGMRLSVVGLPGHVLLGDGPQPERWFDPFAGGAELDLEGCRQLFGRFHPIESFNPAMTEPIDAMVSTIRMLGNLKLSYRNLGDLSQLVKVLELSCALPGSPVTERLELAGALAALGRDDQAAEQRRLLIGLDPARADAHRAAAARHQARRN